MSPSTVLISGASGFIALHTVQALIKKGYKVVGAVRSEEKGEYVKKASGDPSLFSYEIVKDIAQEGAFDEFVKKHPEATAFLHTASPVQFVVNDIEKDLLDPAIKGTKGALQSIKKYGPNIKRVVVTSSSAAIFSREELTNPNITADERSWNNVTWAQALENPARGYGGSKTFAERAAWDFVKNEKPGFELSTVCPVYVFGPQPTNEFNPKSLNHSAQIINSYLKIKDPNAPVEPIIGYAVDVRDVAKAHIAAFEKEEAKNERLVMATGRFTQQTVLDILHANLPKETENLPIGRPGSDKEELAARVKLNNDKTRKILGFEFISVEQSIVDGAKQILEVEGKL